MKNKVTAFVVIIALAALAWLGFDYFSLPAYTLQSAGTWMLLAVYLGLLSFAVGIFRGGKAALKAGPAVFGLITVLTILLGLGNAVFWPGNDGRYQRLLSVERRTAQDFGRDFSSGESRLILPVIDKDIAYAIAQGKMGTYGAQYRILYENFTQVTVKRDGRDVLVRVGPLDYSGVLVALTRGSKGTVGYMEVDVITEQARLVEVPGGMKYTPGAVFSKDLMRRARGAAKGSLLGQYSFEVDDEGHPYWIVPVLRHRVGLFGGADPKAYLLVDAVSGKVERYAAGEQPRWIERAVPTSIVMAQANDQLSLQNGWVNRSWGAKQDVFQISDGYNYVASAGQEGAAVWFVSGITSPAETDQTTVGLLMVDMRDKRAVRYDLAGITEMRARQIAQSDERVRAQTLTATWPIVTAIDGEPVYFMILKNEVQRQRFVFVDLETGARVAMGETIDQARTQFAGLASGGKVDASKLFQARLTVLRARENPADSSLTFIAKGDTATLYVVPLSLGNGVRFLSPGDDLSLRYRESVSSVGQRFVQELRNLSLGETPLE